MKRKEIYTNNAGTVLYNAKEFCVELSTLADDGYQVVSLKKADFASQNDFDDFKNRVARLQSNIYEGMTESATFELTSLLKWLGCDDCTLTVDKITAKMEQTNVKDKESYWGNRLTFAQARKELLVTNGAILWSRNTLLDIIDKLTDEVDNLVESLDKAQDGGKADLQCILAEKQNELKEWKNIENDLPELFYMFRSYDDELSKVNQCIKRLKADKPCFKQKRFKPIPLDRFAKDVLLLIGSAYTGIEHSERFVPLAERDWNGGKGRKWIDKAEKHNATMLENDKPEKVINIEKYAETFDLNGLKAEVQYYWNGGNGTPDAVYNALDTIKADAEKDTEKADAEKKESAKTTKKSKKTNAEKANK